MSNWKLVLHECFFDSPRVEKVGTDEKDHPTFSLKYNDGVAIKIVYESEKNDVIEIEGFSDPYLALKRPGYFRVQHTKPDGAWDLPTFSDPKKLKHYLEQKGIEDIPNLEQIHEDMGIFYDKVKGLKKPRAPDELHDSKCC